MTMNPSTQNNGVAVKVSDLEKKFGDFTAVNHINFEVKEGEIFGFLGPNGAGKSTTIRMLCGIYTPTSGSGSVGGFDIVKEQYRIKEHIGYMSQKFSLYDDLTVEENIDFYSRIYNIPEAQRKRRKDETIKVAGIEEFRKSLTSTLSGGWKQRLALGCAIIHKPKIIFLDEPTSGVDPITRANFWSVIKEMAAQGRTIFVTTHYMDEAENCNRLVMIYHGTMIAMGSPEEMKTRIMKHEILEIVMPNAERWLEKLSGLKSVKEVALFGVNIHAVVYDAQGAALEIKKLFDAQGAAGYSINKIKASLEDVFVSLIENYDAEHKEK
ncbi:MAG: ABC transporter ATP-binding protein [Candidatus Omnitrophica bacterium]|nr:ABC transporter ATP-binding protein [Candidatus Omnitrophota bacterium]MDD5771178.1 ABC transporter ATP-binding protein [Candidatus Omnitrophota bacterium]